MHVMLCCSGAWLEEVVVAGKQGSLGAGCRDCKLYSTRGHKEDKDTIAYHFFGHDTARKDRKSTRLNSSH